MVCSLGDPKEGTPRREDRLRMELDQKREKVLDLGDWNHLTRLHERTLRGAQDVTGAVFGEHKSVEGYNFSSVRSLI